MDQSVSSRNARYFILFHVQNPARLDLVDAGQGRDLFVWQFGNVVQKRRRRHVLLDR